jgi:hypothetical protein
VSIDTLTTVSRTDLASPILDDLCMAPFETGYTHDDLGAVLRIARHLRCRLICEIGTGHGNLTANLLHNCDEATVLTVNPPKELQTGGLITYRLDRDEIGRVYKAKGYDCRVVQLYVNSFDVDFGEHTPPNTVDLGIIDGCHDMKFVLNDFAKLRDFIRPGGVVLFHDTHPSCLGHLAESYRACLLLRKRGHELRWIEDSWWAYWQKP